MRQTLLLSLAAFVLLGSAALAAPPASDDKISEGLWWLYQARYEKAEEVFGDYAKAHPKDPEGYFYETATNWWELAQKLDFKLPAVEARLEQHYEQTMDAAEALANSTSDDKIKARAYLYEGGAEGLKGRWLVAQKVWVKAYFRGKSGNALLRRAIKLDPNLYDAYLGLGIYDYFTDTLPGVQGVLADLFIHGDKKRGLEELQWAIDKGKRSRVEAMMFLIEIYLSEENTPDKALPLAESLRKEFPQSPAMHLTLVTVLYTMKKWPEMTREAQSFLNNSESELPYYDHDGIRPARYCLGVGALYGRHDLDLAFAYMSQLLQHIDSSRWVSYAYLRRGQIYDLRGERDKALQDYQMVLSRDDMWGSHDEANRYIKTPFKF